MYTPPKKNVFDAHIHKNYEIVRYPCTCINHSCRIWLYSHFLFLISCATCGFNIEKKNKKQKQKKFLSGICTYCHRSLIKTPHGPLTSKSIRGSTWTSLCTKMCASSYTNFQFCKFLIVVKIS
jgi:hypothetical protein